MVQSALKVESDKVYIDILTQNDLELLKKKTNNPSSTTSQTTNKKRYFILTYIGEFEKVHYPLPLNFIEEPDAESLRKTITRMKN